MPEARQLLSMAEAAPADSVERHQLLVAAIDAALEPIVVIVGGEAVNMITGTYQPTDIDLVGDVTMQDREVLVGLGFDWGGVGHRHMSYSFSDGEIVLVEFPASELDGIRQPIWHEIVPGIGVWVIALDDLMMDRLQQATDGTDVTMDAAVVLARAALDDVDWQAMEVEADSPGNRQIGVPQALETVRSRARQA